MVEQDDTKSQTSVRDPTFSPPAINLPKGGGAIRGIGEKFAANPVTGTGSMTVPIATSSGRSGFGSQWSLSYDSGSGNGPLHRRGDVHTDYDAAFAGVTCTAGRGSQRIFPGSAEPIRRHALRAIRRLHPERDSIPYDPVIDVENKNEPPGRWKFTDRRAE